MPAKKKTISYTFSDTPERVAKLEAAINKIVEASTPGFRPPGSVENWGQTGGWAQTPSDGWGQVGGWYLIVQNQEAIKISTPEKSLTDVTQIVYAALSKAQRAP